MLGLGLWWALALGPLQPVDATQTPVGPGLHWVDVGQGSALVIREPAGGVIVVDSGPSAGAERLVSALADVERVDLWVHTHWDADHVGGFSRAVAGVDARWPSADDLVVDRLWDRGFSDAPITDAVVLYALLAAERRTDVSGGAELVVGEARVRSLSFDRESTSDENDRGLALCITLPGVRLLAPGDLPAPSVEAAALACPEPDVVWASHHGAVDGISSGVVDRTALAVVVVSAGPQNAYCHPHPATLGLLHAREVWITRAAGVGGGGPCEPIAGALAPEHHIAGGGIWLPLDAR